MQRRVLARSMPATSLVLSVILAMFPAQVLKQARAADLHATLAARPAATLPPPPDGLPLLSGSGRFQPLVSGPGGTGPVTLPAGAFTSYSLGTSSYPDNIVSGPDGNL